MTCNFDHAWYGANSKWSFCPHCGKRIKGLAFGRLQIHQITMEHTDKEEQAATLPIPKRIPHPWKAGAFWQQYEIPIRRHIILQADETLPTEEIEMLAERMQRECRLSITSGSYICTMSDVLPPGPQKSVGVLPIAELRIGMKAKIICENYASEYPEPVVICGLSRRQNGAENISVFEPGVPGETDGWQACDLEVLP